MIRLATDPFVTYQGEGHYLGEKMAFVRFAGCSVGCPKCDTNYQPKISMTASVVVEKVINLNTQWVWITGGEPTDQMDGLNELVYLLERRDKLIALATSGIREAPRVHYLSVSPHSAGFVQRVGTEIKLVPLLNGLDIWSIDLSDIQFAYRYVMPMHGSQESMDICLDWIEQHPEWKLTVQAHKVWRLP